MVNVMTNIELDPGSPHCADHINVSVRIDALIRVLIENGVISQRHYMEELIVRSQIESRVQGELLGRATHGKPAA